MLQGNVIILRYIALVYSTRVIVLNLLSEFIAYLDRQSSAITALKAP